MKIGDVDIAKDIIELNYQLIRTQKILELLLNQNAENAKLIASKMQEIDEASIEKIQSKFPGMGIRKK